MLANKLPNPGWKVFVIGNLGLTEAEVSQEQGVTVGGLAETCWKMLKLWRDFKHPLNTRKHLEDALQSACAAGIDTTHAMRQLDISGQDMSEAFSTIRFSSSLETTSKWVSHFMD